VIFYAEQEHIGCGTQIATAEKVTPFKDTLASWHGEVLS
jgi:hypothetical protein